MRRPSHKQLQRVAKAARLYASSMIWETVAQALGCRPIVCSRWPRKYPGKWGRFFVQAQQQQRYEETNRLVLETIRELSR